MNGGAGQMSWSVAASTLSGGTWLSVTPTTGLSNAEVASVPQVTVSVDPSSLPPGVYSGRIAVTAPQADDAAQTVSMTLNVVAAGGNTGAVVQPSGLSFTTAKIFRNGNVLVKVTPETGTVSATQPLQLNLQAQTPALPSGIYRNTLTLAFSDGSTRNISVIVLATPMGTISGDAVEFPEPEPKTTGSACTPKQLVPIFTQLADGQPIPAGWPGQLNVKAFTDCGVPMTAGGVTVTFTNGDAAVRLTSLKDGSFAGIWVPRNTQGIVKLTALATIPEQSLSGQTAIQIGVSGVNPSPVISASYITRRCWLPGV